ncbi:MAG: shikimate dehydrogenase [Gemmataceae bacterium]
MQASLERVCVVIGRTRHRMVAAELQEAAKLGARMLEIRLDYIAHAPDFRRLIDKKPCPVVATIRRREDGGRWSGTEEARQMLLRQCVVGGFDWVDLETDVADHIPRFGPVKRIVSYHNLEGIPDNLDEIYAKMCRQDADVLKLAVTAHQPADNLRILELLKNAKRPTTAHCMGDIGFPSRILALKYGAPFIYAAFNEERVLAPGMPVTWDLQHSYPIDKINADTKVFGVIGDPVAHSLSPLLHNRLFHRHNINGVYLPFRVPRGQLQPFVDAFDRLPVAGYSVTIPHKEGAAALATNPDAIVQQTHAANTLIRQAAGGFTAANTDYEAVVDALAENLPNNEDGKPGTLAGKMVLLLGAGGAARAVAHALKKAGCVLTIANRTPEKANALAAECEARVRDWMGRHVATCDILINATAVGMHPNVDDTPLHAGFLQPGMVVFDLVYNPESTVLVKDARARSCRVITGVELFVRQAAKQFKLFTGIDPNLDRMRQIVRRALSPITHYADEEGDLTDGEPPPP